MSSRTVTPTRTPTEVPTPILCVGDCDGKDGMVRIGELIRGVRISLGELDLSNCPSFDMNREKGVETNELIKAVANALHGCPRTPCPIEPGSYTLTQMSGGTMKLGPLSPFPFPAGGQIIQEVGEGDDDCVHEMVVPDDGFAAPVFCVPALSFTVGIEQTGCGVGLLDSDGGSDFTVTEVGDTSDSSTTCRLPHPNCSNASMDSRQRVDVTVGDGSVDVCETGTANAIISIPVSTRVWSAPDCPDSDGTPDRSDTLILEFPQILDFTTDAAASRWEDLDGDGCMIAGAGPLSGLAGAGSCLDLGTSIVITAAAGTIGSGGRPLFDLSALTILPNTWSGPEASTGATCNDPPTVNFSGTAIRCIE